MGAMIVFIVIPILCALIIPLFAEDSRWQERRRFSELIQASLERERNPKPKRGYRYVRGGFRPKRR